MKVLRPPALLFSVLTVLALLVGLLLVCARLFAPIASIQLNPAQVTHETGLAYVAPLEVRSNLLFKFRFDAPGSNASRLALLEDGKPLGPAHSAHAEIRQQGQGRFSHWGAALWFSASDATDPRTNGRRYTAEAKLSAQPIWNLVGIVLLAFGLLAIALRPAARLSERIAHAFATAARQILVPVVKPRQPSLLAVMLMAVIGIAIGAGAVVYGWYAGDTSITGLAIARYLPVSDAFGYHSCATFLAASGEFGESLGNVWCVRRVLYPAMLASLLNFTAWSSQLTLIAQGGLVGLAIAIFSLAVGSLAGALAACLAAVLLFFYAWEFIFGLFMTEVLGFVLGLLGLTLLIGFCKTKQPYHLAAGASLLSVGLAARAGALLALPMLCLWGLFAFPGMSHPKRIRYLFITLISVLIGPVLQFALVSLLGADVSGTGGNYAASLYGLSTGSRDWSQAYRDFADLFQQTESVAFRRIYKIALENIVANPDVFAGALIAAARLYFTTLFAFISVTRVNVLLSLLAALGLFRCAFNLQLPAARLLVALAIAELLSAPLIIDSGELRIFAVTIPLRILFCALGLQWILQHVIKAPNEAYRSFETAEAKSPLSLATITGAVVLMLIVSPATPLSRIGQLRKVAGVGCPTGLTEVVARLSKESQSLTMVEANAKIASLDPFRITPTRLQDDSRLPKTWFGKEFLDLQPLSSLIRVVELSGQNAFTVKPLLLDGDVRNDNARYSLCIDEKSFTEFAQVKHYSIKTIKQLPE